MCIVNLFHKTFGTKRKSNREANMNDVHMLTLKGRNVDSDIKGYILKAKHQRTGKKMKHLT